MQNNGNLLPLSRAIKSKTLYNWRYYAYYYYGGFFPLFILYLLEIYCDYIFGIFFTMAAVGDFLVINLVRKEKMNDLVLDHPSKMGCFIDKN